MRRASARLTCPCMFGEAMLHPECMDVLIHRRVIQSFHRVILSSGGENQNFGKSFTLRFVAASLNYRQALRPRAGQG